ncbi:MAG: RadC family protein [Planctomycetota bacterium]
MPNPTCEPDQLTDAQLLDMVMQRSPPGVQHPGARRPPADPDAEPPMARLLLRCGSLRRLATRSTRELKGQYGLDSTSARRLQGLFVLAQRLAEERMEPGDAFLSPRQIFDHFHSRFRDHKKEIFCVVLLDARHRVMGEERISEGSLTSSIVHPREVFVPAVRESAGAVVFVHNHPSGEPSPSEDDIAVTRRLERAAELLGIRVLDHVIIGDGVYASFKEMGLI